MQDFEKLGEFYLGRHYDVDAREVTDEPLLYDSRDLVTHAFCVGMTGSGKTGLGVGLLEEAALDGVPAIVIDPKGDMGDLCLTFPELLPSDFQPYVDVTQAEREGMTPEAKSQALAELWTKGLARWGQGKERIARLRQAAEVRLYTPGSSAGRSLSVLRSFTAPTAEQLEDPEASRERLTSVVSGLLGLLGQSSASTTSPEHVFLANVVQHEWSAGRDLSLGDLVRLIQRPPIETVGVMDVDTFFPEKKRTALAMSLNSVLASPSFASWLEGEPLDVGSLLYDPEGRPRVSVLSIAHLGESERMFFVTLLLGEVISWMRRQTGTSSLRALLYMDEVFGFLPPVANPPSKAPMLTLLKQARAFGLGIVLATQNPVDIDYKALSNCGTWLLGRLSTERDVARVAQGLRGASEAAGASVDVDDLERLLAGLDKRVFLLHDVHQPGRQLFHTRWALSYLAGPLTRAQIRSLHASEPESTSETVPALGAPTTSPLPAGPQPLAVAAAASAPTPSTSTDGGARQVIPPHYREVFLGAPQGEFVYQAGFLATLSLRYVLARAGLDQAKEVTLLVPVEEDVTRLWHDATPYDEASLLFSDAPAEGARYLPLAMKALGKGARRSVEASLKRTLRDEQPLVLGYCPAYKLFSRPDEDRAAFGARVRLAAREARDEEMEKLREQAGRSLARLEEKRRKALARIDKERGQLAQRKLERNTYVGRSILGGLFGRSAGITTAARSAGRVSRQKGDVRRAQDSLIAVQTDLEEAQEQLDDRLAEIRARYEEPPSIEEQSIRARKQDLSVLRLDLAWVPVVPPAAT